MSKNDLRKHTETCRLGPEHRYQYKNQYNSCINYIPHAT